MDNTEKFPNGIASYLETHFEITSFISNELRKDTTEYSGITTVAENQGSGGIYELVEDLTDEFEALHSDNDWIEMEFLETLEQFVHDKLI